MSFAPDTMPDDEVHSASEDKSSVLFLNDRGELAADTRRALVALLTGPSIDSRRQPKLWEVLKRDEPVLRSRLNDVFLELVVDREQEAAFTRQVTAEDLDAPILLRRESLSFLETVLVIFLRSRLTQSNAHGDRATVSVEEMLESMSIYERADNTDRVKYVKQCQQSIDKAKRLNFLHKIRGTEERYEVSPTLKLLFPAEEIQALTALYQSLPAPTGETLDADAGDLLTTIEVSHA